MQHRRDFLRTAAAAAASALLPSALLPAVRKPNFLVILADDMGFSDARCYGGDIDTPHLDRMAARGLRFTQAYSTARCGPSRSCLLTGQYAQQTASDIMTPGRIPNYTRFLPEYLKPLGYRTYHSGKWHMKHVTGYDGVGFDHSYTMMDELRFFTQNNHLLDGRPLPKPEPGYYSTTAIADYSIRFLKEHARDRAADPFFLYTAFHAPHFPLQAPQADIDKYHDRFSEGWDTARERKWQRMVRMGIASGSLAPLEPNMWTKWNTPDAQLIAKIGPGEISRAVPWSTLTPEQKTLQRTKMAIHAAMISRMDDEIGKLLKQVEAMGELDNTVVLFLSDNGASSEQMIRGDGHDASASLGSARTHLGLGPGWASCSNAPFRLHKSWVNEGGISSPLIVHWPQGIPAKNELRHDQCHFIDVLPTLVDLAGGKSEPILAGRSIASAFTRDNSVPRDYLYFNHNHNRALRIGDRKLISTGDDGPWELYDMATDRTEQKNIAAAEPAVAARLSARWKEIDDNFTKVRESAPPSQKKLMPATKGN
jgi:arylsulfatase A-like enzyme